MNPPRLAICNELYEGWSFDAVCRHASQLGYQGLEIAPLTLKDAAGAVDPVKVRELKQAARSHALEILGLHWLLAGTQGVHVTSPDPAIQQRTVDTLNSLVNLCAELGGHLMVWGSPQQRQRAADIELSAAMQLAARVIRQVVPRLEERGVTLAVEPLGPQETNFINTADEAVELIHLIGSPRVGLHLDVKAMSTEAIPIPEIIHKHNRELVHFHANDPNRRGPGMGTVAFAPILSALREVRYGGWISVEVFDFTPGVDALAGDSIRYLQQTWNSLPN